MIDNTGIVRSIHITMSLLPDDKKFGNSSNVPHVPPPVRKLFPLTDSEDVDENNIHESDTFKVYLRIKPHSKIDNPVSFYVFRL